MSIALIEKYRLLRYRIFDRGRSGSRTGVNNSLLPILRLDAFDVSLWARCLFPHRGVFYGYATLQVTGTSVTDLSRTDMVFSVVPWVMRLIMTTFFRKSLILSLASMELCSLHEHKDHIVPNLILIGSV